MAVHALRFASILVGAGLILRAGAAERAMSAVDEDRSAGSFPALPQAQALTLPQPAFGRDMAFGRHAPVAPQKAKLAAGASAPVPQIVTADLAAGVPAPPAGAKASFVSVRNSEAKNAALVSPVAVAPQASSPATSLLQSAPAIVVRPTVSAAPAAPAAVAPSLAVPHAALAPVAQSVVQSGVQPVARAAAHTEAVSSAPAVVASSLALPTSPAPVAGVRQHSVTPPSDIETVLHSAASAWDYAEGVPDDLRGAPAARQSYPAPAF